MDNQSVSFAALVPASGFRWIHRDAGGQWHVTEPPEDWPEADYEAARENRPPSELTGAFYIGASDYDIVRAQLDQKSSVGTMRSEPDLYLSFASERPTPRRIQEFANIFGLLRLENARLLIPRKDAGDLEQAFNLLSDEIEDDEVSDPEILYFTAENAYDWLREFESALIRLKLAPSAIDVRDAHAVEVMRNYLDWGFNRAVGGNLHLHFELDKTTGRIRGNFIASSLADLLRVQFGMSVAGNVVHRQCQECVRWFSVHPASGRPTKIFCSDACRMRAYRRRLKNNRRAFGGAVS